MLIKLVIWGLTSNQTVKHQEPIEVMIKRVSRLIYTLIKASGVYQWISALRRLLSTSKTRNSGILCGTGGQSTVTNTAGLGTEALKGIRTVQVRLQKCLLPAAVRNSSRNLPQLEQKCEVKISMLCSTDTDMIRTKLNKIEKEATDREVIVQVKKCATNWTWWKVKEMPCD